MKLVSLIARLALVGVAASILGFAVDVQALGLFAFATGALFLLVVAGDYASPHRAPDFGIQNMLSFPPQSAGISAQELAA